MLSVILLLLLLLVLLMLLCMLLLQTRVRFLLELLLLIRKIGGTGRIRRLLLLVHRVHLLLLGVVRRSVRALDAEIVRVW